MELLLRCLAVLTSVGLLAYSIHGWTNFLWFVRARRRGIRAGAGAAAREPPALSAAPVLTTQIAIGNDGVAADRIIRAAAAMEYPKGCHEIQVLDASTDETRLLVERLVRALRQAGHRISILHRRERNGGRAAALAHGLREASGELVAVLDPQHIPPPDFLNRVVPFFLRDEGLGVVHVSAGSARPDSQAARCDPAADPLAEAARTGIPGNFAHGATVWRRDAIHDGGGWQGDTLIEQLDLSYRVRIRGWRTRHLADLDVRAEPPATVIGCQATQVRWAKGAIQVARKLLPRLWRTRLGLRVKLSATLHLTQPVLHPLMLIALLLAVPAAEAVSTVRSEFQPVIIGLIVTALAAPHALYLATQRLLYRGWWRHVAAFPILVCVGVGIAVANSRAVLDGVTGRRGARGMSSRGQPPFMAWIEVAVGAYCAISLGLYLSSGRLVLAPLLFAYAVGFLVTGVSGLQELYEDRAMRLRRLLATRRASAPRPSVRGLRPRSAG